MRQTLKGTGRRFQRGVIAIETAIVLPILLLFLGLPSVIYAFYFRQYTAVQKAAHDVAIYLSTASRLEMTTAGSDNKFAALSVAQQIVAQELKGIIPDGTLVDINFSCNYRIAGSSPKGNSCTPTIFKFDTYKLVRIDVAIGLPYVNPLTGVAVDSMYMQTVVASPYMGN